MTDQPRRSLSDWLKGLLPAGAPPHHSEDHEPTFPDFLISWRTMEPRQKALTGLVIAQIIVSALALVLHNLPPSLPVASEDISFGIATLNYLLSIVAMIAAVTLVAGGMLYAHWIGRWMFFLCLAGLYILVICGFYPDTIEQKIGGVVLVFAIPFAILAGAGMPAAYRARYSPERQQAWLYRSVQTIWFLFASLFIAGFVAACFQPIQYANLLLIVHIPLPYLFLLAGTDWAEIDDSIVRSGYEWIAKGRSVNTLKAALAIVATASMIMMAAFGGPQVLYLLPVAAGAAVLLYLVMRGARFTTRWPVGFPWAALAILVILTSVAADIFGRTWEGALAVAIAGLSVCAGALVLLRRRAPLSRTGPVLLFGVVQGVVMFWLLVPMPGVTDRFWALIFWIATASLAGLGWLMWRGRSGEDVREPVRLLLVLNVSLLILCGLFAVIYEFAVKFGEYDQVAFALIMLVALTWDILVSGHTITNADGGLFPRRSRLLLFFSYVSMVVATVLFFASLHLQSPRSTEAMEIEEAVHTLGDPEVFVQRGIAVFGPATLVTLFLLRLGRWRASLAAPARAVHESEAVAAVPTGPAGETA